MASGGETASIRGFVRDQLRGEPDLSTLTLGTLRKQYLAHVGSDSLSVEARNYMKRVVQEELMKMQDNDENQSELETTKSQNKRKREKENEKVTSGSEEEAESRAKKSRGQPSSSSESEDEEEGKTGSGESEEEEEEQRKSGSEEAQQEGDKSQAKTNGGNKQEATRENSTDDDESESENKENERNCGGSPQDMKKMKKAGRKNGEARTGGASQGNKRLQSEGENETDTHSKSERSDKGNSSESSDEDRENEKASAEKKNSDPDSDSSSLPSLEEERNSGTENKQDNVKKKSVKRDESARGQKDENKAVARLKRYIALCGVRRNYKKLLDGCRSVRSMVAVLKKELEDLGVHGNPSIEKCKKVRMKREEAQELADLDMSNIIATQGRPKRRGRTDAAWQEQGDPPSSTYQRTLNSDSGSDEEKDPHRGQKRATDWTNLQGIISDDADSD